MNSKNLERLGSSERSPLSNLLGPFRWHALAIGGAYLILLVATWFGYLDQNGFRQLSLVDFEVGKVAERDVVAGREISYIDESATRLRKEARQKLVTAVFRYDRLISASMISDFTTFADSVLDAARMAPDMNRFTLEMQQQYPGYFDAKLMQSLYDLKDPSTVLQQVKIFFNQLVSEGIAEFPDRGMEQFSQSTVEIVRWRDDRQERMETDIDHVLTRGDVRGRVLSYVSAQKKSFLSSDTLYGLLAPFIRVNILYQDEESESKLEAALKQVQPVLVVIPKGQKIVKRGFIVTDEQFSQLKALSDSGVHVDVRQFLGNMLFLAVIVILGIYLMVPQLSGVPLGLRNTMVLVSMFILMYLIALIASRTRLFSDPFDLAIILPSALMTMMVTVLIHQRIAAMFSFLLTLAVLCASGFSVAPSMFVLFSGLSGVAVMRITGKRIDLVKSSGFLALINPGIVLILSTMVPSPSGEVSRYAVGAAINGFMSGILVLGFLPILESLLNTSTSFRLMEFSDLNSPIMKRMLLSVSGTYNHSIMVATLAESACREIGADPLLARVGAYYHDIGKMDQSEYFVENQLDYNKHLDLNPRLSATVIRSHVKQGIEKARQMRLPKEVVEIISEHHGNSLISYFYNEAKKREESVDPEDFTYPGNPPSSRESAVVMLADVVEAACRTLDKPSVPRLEKFIGELIANKIENHQLDNSDLTFREIGIIKKSFVTILAGYYHSRIEYPNQKDPDSADQPAREGSVKGKKS